MTFECIDSIPSESKLRVSRLKPHDVIGIIPPYKTKKEVKTTRKIAIMDHLR